jgi:hypothetical protein
MIEIGQLRQWKQDAGLNGEVFLVIGFTEMTTSGERRFVDYLMNGEHCWDDEEWVEHRSVAVS